MTESQVRLVLTNLDLSLDPIRDNLTKATSIQKKKFILPKKEANTLKTPTHR